MQRCFSHLSPYEDSSFVLYKSSSVFLFSMNSMQHIRFYLLFSPWFIVHLFFLFFFSLPLNILVHFHHPFQSCMMILCCCFCTNCLAKFLRLTDWSFFNTAVTKSLISTLQLTSACFLLTISHLIYLS